MAIITRPISATRFLTQKYVKLKQKSLSKLQKEIYDAQKCLIRHESYIIPIESTSNQTIFP
ncbi:MAG: hypothetical protein ACI4UA_08800, partial [Bacteroidaceae bacterium]